MKLILSLVRKASAWILKPIFPRHCIFCHKIIEHGSICEKCDKNLPIERSISSNVPMVNATYAPFYYDGNVVDAIRRYKFKSISAYAKPFSKFMIECIEKNLNGEFDCVTWVPISSIRHRERGFDQAYLLAEEIAEYFHLPLVRALKKIRHNKRQSSQKSVAARRANVIGAYKIIDYDSILGRRVLIVDDIVTTGATVSECARMLRGAGARKILCVTFAKTKKKN